MWVLALWIHSLTYLATAARELVVGKAGHCDDDPGRPEGTVASRPGVLN